MRLNALRTALVALILSFGPAIPTIVHAQSNSVFAVRDIRLETSYGALLNDIDDEIDKLVAGQAGFACVEGEGPYIDDLYDRGEDLLRYLKAAYVVAAARGDYWGAKNAARRYIQLDEALDDLDYEDCETFGYPESYFDGYTGFQVLSGPAIGFLALDIGGALTAPYRTYRLDGTGSVAGIKGIIDLARLFRIVPPLNARAMWGRVNLAYGNVRGEGYASNIQTTADFVLLPGLGVGLFPNGVALNNIGNAAQIGNEAFSFRMNQLAFQYALGFNYLFSIWTLSPYIALGYRTFDFGQIYSATFPAYLGAVAYQSQMAGRVWEYGLGLAVSWWCPLFGPSLPTKFYVDAQGGLGSFNVRSIESLSFNLNNGATADDQQVAIARNAIVPWLQLTLGAVLFPVLDSRFQMFANYTLRMSNLPVTVWPGGGALPRIDFRTAWTQTFLIGLAYALKASSRQQL